MRRHLLTAAGLIGMTLIARGVVIADGTQSSMVNPQSLAGATMPAITGPIGAAFADGTSKAQVKSDNKCNFQVKISGLALPDSDGTPGTGDEVICIADFHITMGALNTNLNGSLVTRGEISGGKVKIKVNLAAEGTPCVPTGGGSDTQQYDARLACYEPSAAYAPAFTAPFLTDATEGLIFAAAGPGGFAPRPVSNLIAVAGSNSQ
ncbi:MAG TPA: hypothetical protein VE911_07985 [Candidatus Nitrosopolaris sp.]|nr:hypothetical protein [Candidatus Nitrosopolaris sp.]